MPFDKKKGIQLKSIYRYPIKGFRGVEIPHTLLYPGAGISLDRSLAIANGLFDAQSGDEWISCRAFLRLAKNNDLYKYDIHCDEESGDITIDLSEQKKVNINVKSTYDQIEANVSLEAAFGCGVYPVLRQKGKAGYWDHEDAAISIVNLESVRQLSRLLGLPLDAQRFRANLYIEGLPAGSEYSLIGKNICIGLDNPVKLEVLRPIDRCKATSIDPLTGDQSINIPALLDKLLGHMFFGLYARVIKGGRIAKHDIVSINEVTNGVTTYNGTKVSTAPSVAYWPRAANIIQRIIESETVTSYWLEDPFITLHGSVKPGQYYRVHIIDSSGNPSWRAYTVSAVDGNKIRFTIKLKGTVSRHLFESLNVPSSIYITGPFGTLMLPQSQAIHARSIMFYSSGIGITPVVSLVKELARIKFKHHLNIIHVAQKLTDLPLWDELKSCVSHITNVSINLYLTKENNHLNTDAKTYIGRPDWNILHDNHVLSDSEHYICGSVEFVNDVSKFLATSNVPLSQIHTEAFISPPTSDTSPVVLPNISTTNEKMTVKFAKAGIQLTWDSSSGSLLELAESAGFFPPSHCRSGVCGACRTRLVSGKVIHSPAAKALHEQNEVLLCCAYPSLNMQDIVLDI
ncbi:oxidoreductase, FAD-binding/iron-sulfur cluster binding protein [Pseudomonas luteola]|uniref:Oxidoreductase, FAD-binding/iron-sulfur cluster binding protein n=1 Tax=Pseudomonas luteola TaxID=47886 RepID=A0A2X2EDY4_PSELU|nr:2Fe-2S iron-sulfur cluster-binding protein [Pseudomonas luteola]SPZ04870.1 oxidoreductase, FAD-binding/iron-sulfur cluster binding protein [Pseudomonas luteola]